MCIRDRHHRDHVRPHVTADDRPDAALQKQDAVVALAQRLLQASGVLRAVGVAAVSYTHLDVYKRQLSILREEHGFRGYIHAKAVPGTSPELVQQPGHLANRMSVNMELPSPNSLQLLAPQKDKQRIIAPMRQIRDNIAVDKDCLLYTSRCV